MITDAPPRKKNRVAFVESDRMKRLELPANGSLPALSQTIELAMKSGNSTDVRRACGEFLRIAAEFYNVPTCDIRVLAARPLRVRRNCTTELFGDYHPDTMMVRVWMRTAVRKEVTSFGTFLSTLCHEFCHHLDFKRFGFGNSWHTRGFYERTAVLYHHMRGTLPKPLVWAPISLARWRIDWPKTNRAGTPMPQRQSAELRAPFGCAQDRAVPHTPR
ncbi:MAG TPA: hypothetical protein VMF66_17360 [Candidatus Acidoferrum sp.]|nr:hypothetical protein [Candidatus Acidoferrum sp.]